MLSQRRKQGRLQGPENAASVTQEFDKIIRTNKKNIIWQAYHQGITFRKFK